MEYNPRAVFEKLFGDTGTSDRAARQARLQQHKSILDSVSEKLAELKRELGPNDQSKVNEYADAVGVVDRRIQKAEEQADAQLTPLEHPPRAQPGCACHLY